MLTLLTGLALADPWPPPLTLSVEPVAETCLSGPADAEYWRAALAPEGLTPLLTEGRAWLTVCATRARFGGRSFGEGTLGVATADGGLFLVGAINDVRSYAWVERRRNRSPYVHGDSTRSAGAVRLGAPDGAVLVATRAERPGHPEPLDFTGPIWLPATQGEPGGAFWAALTGDGLVWQIDPTVDHVEIGPAALAAPLRDSGWAPTRWTAREASRHAKSDTVARPTR